MVPILLSSSFRLVCDRGKWRYSCNHDLSGFGIAFFSDVRSTVFVLDTNPAYVSDNGIAYVRRRRCLELFVVTRCRVGPRTTTRSGARARPSTSTNSNLSNRPTRSQGKAKTGRRRAQGKKR